MEFQALSPFQVTSSKVKGDDSDHFDSSFCCVLPGECFEFLKLSTALLLAMVHAPNYLLLFIYRFCKCGRKKDNHSKKYGFTVVSDPDASWTPEQSTCCDATDAYGEIEFAEDPKSSRKPVSL